MNNTDKLEELQSKRSEIESKSLSKDDKISARERIKLLFDEGSFVEINAFANCDTESERVVSGYGTVNERLVYAYSQDYTSFGGALGINAAKKIEYIMDMASKMGAPVVAVLDSEGAKIAEGIDALSSIGKIFEKNVALSGLVPQISVVLGNCAGGAIFTPSISDFVIMAAKNTKMYLTPAVNSDDNSEEFGSASYCAENGIADFVCDSEGACFDKVRELLSYLPLNNLEGTPADVPADDINRLSENILNIIPDNSDGFDIRNIISEVADSSKVFEIACDFAQSIFVGFIKLNGVTVGVVANNSIKNDGEISVSSAKKASKFINFCDSFNIPIITFADCGDFSSSGCHEKQYLADSAANLIASYVNATVPKITVIVRRAYGSTYLAMGSKACGADMVFAYPTAEISIMPPEGAANIMYSEEISTSDNPIECRKQMIERYKREIASPYIAASKGYIDDIIEPDSTRPRLISAIEMLFSKRVQSAAKKHINMPL